MKQDMKQILDVGLPFMWKMLNMDMKTKLPNFKTILSKMVIRLPRKINKNFILQNGNYVNL
jgi:hypothetical protein